MRKIKGVFLENLELNDFPVDVQVGRTFLRSHPFLGVKDLTITVSTTRTVNEVSLLADTTQLSAINTRKTRREENQREMKEEFVDAFIDQQEWRLHEHVETSTKLLSSPFTPSQNQHPAFSATCQCLSLSLSLSSYTLSLPGRAARRPGYFYWNVYFLIVNLFLFLSMFARLCLCSSSSR